ncbi:MAG TPA: restriction endonuclease [Polyangiaceae bacterium]|nr:restriction endonuclease [Polyangiaceae bacterium]
MSLKEIHSFLQQQVNPSWTHQAQPAYRLNWLRSLALVEKDERGFTLTELGRSIGAEKTTKVSVPPPSPTPARTYAGQLTARLAEMAIDSEHPTQFEEALREAFDFLGFDAQKIGGAGKPDVVARASIDPNSYSVVIDAKTTSRGAISQSHVNLNALLDHRKKARADYVAVVGVTFSGDNLPKWAKEQNVRLIDVDALCQILLRHEATPFSLLDLKPLLAGGGVVDGTSVVDDLMRIADEIEEAQNLPAQIFRVLLEKQAGCRARIDEHSLYFLLDEEYEVDEIRAALDFLRSPGVAAIVADERGGLSTRYGLRTFVARMNRIAAIAANGDTLAGQGGAG